MTGIVNKLSFDVHHDLHPQSYRKQCGKNTGKPKHLR